MGSGPIQFSFGEHIDQRANGDDRRRQPDRPGDAERSRSGATRADGTQRRREEWPQRHDQIQVAVNLPERPAAPSNLRGYANGSSLTLGWTNSAAGGVPTNMRLLVSGATNAALTLPVVESFTFDNVPAASYNFTVQAQNRECLSASTTNALTLTFPGTCPGPPPADQLRRNEVGHRDHRVVDTVPNRSVNNGLHVDRVGRLHGFFATTGRSMSGAVSPGQYTLRVVANNACGATSTAPTTVAIP